MYVYPAVSYKFLWLAIEHNHFRNAYHLSYLIHSYLYSRSTFLDSFLLFLSNVEQVYASSFHFLMISSNRVNAHSLWGVNSPVITSNRFLFGGLIFLSCKMKASFTGHILCCSLGVGRQCQVAPSCPRSYLFFCKFFFYSSLFAKLWSGPCLPLFNER